MVLQPVDLSFADKGTPRLQVTLELAASPTAIFDALIDCGAWPTWFIDCLGCSWLSNGTPGEGSVREIRLKLVRAKERILAAEPGRRFAFTVLESSGPPLVKALLEDFRLEPLGGGTRLIWTMDYRPTPLGWLLQPVFRRLFRRTLVQSFAALDRQLGVRAAAA
jgi:uncharacterized protein YndB with AHSA1/START domain